MRFATMIPARHDRGAPGRALRAIALSVCALVAAPAAWAGYTLGWFSTYGSAATSSAAGYTLSATAGQPAAVVLTGTSYSLWAGFWAGIGGAYTADVGDDPSGAADPPLALRLHAVTPNPLVDHALVRFDLPREGPVHLRVYDIAGRLQAIIVNETLPAGRHQRLWNAAGDDGRPVSAGIYFVLLEAQSTRMRQRVVVMR